jgi:hypothetical protein
MSSISFRRLAQALLCLCVLVALPALADPPTCVTTAAQLQAALTAAASDNQANHIGLMAGTYSFSAPLTATVSDGFPVTIEGGYTTSTCTGLPIPVADNTIIAGVAASGAHVRIVGDGGLDVSNLTFSGFKPAAGTNAIVFGENDGGSMLHIENTTIAANGVTGISDRILALYVSGGLLFDDNVVHDNTISNASVYIYADYPGAPLSVANNTIAGNLGPGLWMDTYSMFPTYVYNNILWNNAINDLILTNSHVLAMNNTWLHTSIDANSGLETQSANNSTADPKLTAGYRLGTNSPALNTGLPAPMLLPFTDAADNLRVIGSAPDQGAYESSVDDFAGHTYLVTSVNDSGILTLRQAIADANAAGAPARINIHIGTGCGPQTIILNTPLPAITVPMMIDGYYQPGATMNMLGRASNGEVKFNAGICIFLAGDPINKPGYGLRVDADANPNVHLEVRGLAFTFFTSAAIDIGGGNGSWIHGNGFGETTAGSTFANNIGVDLHGGTATVIGGPKAADANLIGNNHYIDGIGILLGNGEHFAMIDNNNIGGNASAGATGNAHAGIQVQMTNGHQIRNNWIVGNGSDGIRIDNAHGILVQANTIGSSSKPELANVGSGVHLLNDTYGLWIGTTDPQFPPSAGGNGIAGNNGPGVWIDSDASVFNEVTGNSIYANTGLAIDLGQLGPSANTGTENSGPNRLLHKPTLTSATAATVGNIAVKGSIATNFPNALRHVTIYASSRCGGDAKTWLGDYLVQADASGTLDLSLTVPAPDFSPAYITATDENYAAGFKDNSEISNSRLLSVAGDIFNDGFDCY